MKKYIMLFIIVALLSSCKTLYLSVFYSDLREYSSTLIENPDAFLEKHRSSKYYTSNNYFEMNWVYCREFIKVFFRDKKYTIYEEDWHSFDYNNCNRWYSVMFVNSANYGFVEFKYKKCFDNWIFVSIIYDTKPIGSGPIM